MSINKPLKVEFKKNIALRDTLYTMDAVLTTIGNRIGESFNDTTLYPAIESNNGEMSSGVVSSEAKKFSTPLKLLLSGDVTGSVVFDGSEGSNPGITLYNNIIKINNKDVATIFDNDGYVTGSNTLGKTKTDEATGVKSLEGNIGDTNLGNIFQYSDSGSLTIKKASETEKFDDYRYIKLDKTKSDFTGCLRSIEKDPSSTDNYIISNGSKFSYNPDPESSITDEYSYFEGFINIEQYIPTSYTLGYKWKNPVTNEIEYIEKMTTDISAHLNAVINFVYEIPTNKFNETVNGNTFFMVQPNVSSVEEYNIYSKMNMVIKYEDSKWKIYCYTNDVVPNMKLVKILKFGRIDNKS